MCGANFKFSKPEIKAIVTTVGRRAISFMESAESMGLSEKEALRLAKTLSLNTRHVVSGNQTTTDLCFESAMNILATLNLDAKSVDALIMVTQSPDYASPSSANNLQHRLGLSERCMAFDMRLGCSGFVYGLSVAYSLVESGLERVLLCVGDVASRLVKADDHSIAPIMGDAGSAILIDSGKKDSFFQLYSDGSGERALYIPNSGVRYNEFDKDLPCYIKMDGAQVFNFTLQRVPSMLSEVLTFSNFTKDDIDYFILHQPNKYILNSIQKICEIPDIKFPKDTQSIYGNQNSASIPGTISGFLSHVFERRQIRSIFAGFGIGLSWGACMIQTDKIYCPPTVLQKE